MGAARSPSPGRAAAGAGAVVALAALLFAACGESGREETVPPSAPPGPAEEFRAVAERLFANPGGFYDRGASARLLPRWRDGAADWRARAEAGADLVDALLAEGRTEEAVAVADELLALLRERPGYLRENPRFHLVRALAWLRLSEVENCIRRNNRDCCVYPLAGGGVHEEKEPAAKAAEAYLEYLFLRPDDLRARWLLNVAHMALGTWPDSVPEAFRIPDRAPGASDDFPRFRDVAREAGLDRLNHAGGVVVEDLDGDGRLDILFSCIYPTTPCVLYRNRGDGTFEDVSEAAGLADQPGALNAVGADYDGDGDVDLLLLRGGWGFAEGRVRNSLLRNEGDGTFVDVTRAAGLAEPAAPTQVGVWFDYDADGDLDLFVGNESLRDAAGTPEETARHDHPSNLFRNEGDGTFVDVAAAAGVTNDRFVKGATAGDFDDDGDVDLYVSNFGPNRLYRNEGDGTFVDVAEAAGVTEPAGRSFVPWFFDFDNDGRLDLFVGAYDAGILADVAAFRLQRPHDPHPPRLYRNRGDGTFEDVTEAAGLVRPMEPMGAGFGDLDNDGRLDFYLGTGDPDYEALLPNLMFRNVDGRRFEDVTVAGGFGLLQKGHGVVFADVDDDGDQDVVHQVGGFLHGDVFYNSLFENPGNGNRFLTLKLVGTRSNRSAYGARIRVTVATPSGPRHLHRTVGSTGSFGSPPARAEIGLGDATAIESVEIRWPSGRTERRTGFPLDSFHTLTEPR